MLLKRLLKFLPHPLRFARRQRNMSIFASNKTINPSVVKRIELERIFRCIQMPAQIVARMSSDARHNSGT